jgi:hypothetical protein
MEMFASFYATKTVETHGTGYCAYYMGRNSIWNGDKKAPRSMFKSDADWKDYIKGRQSAQAEERLNLDTEWDD